MESNQLPQLIEAEVNSLVVPKDLSEKRVEEIKTSFKPFLEEIIKAQKLVGSVEVKNAKDKEGIKQAKEVLRAFKDNRVNANKKRAELKKEPLAEGKFIQSIYNTIEEVCKKQEEVLYPKAQIAEIAKKRKQERLEQLRRDKVVGLEAFFPMSIDFIKTTEEDFSKMYDAAIQAKEAAEKAAKEREEEEAMETQQNATEDEALKQAQESAEKLHQDISPGTTETSFHSPAMTRAGQENNIPSVTLNEQADLKKLLKVFENVRGHLEKNIMVSSPIGNELKERAMKENEELISIINSKI